MYHCPEQHLLALLSQSMTWKSIPAHELAASKMADTASTRAAVETRHEARAVATKCLSTQTNLLQIYPVRYPFTNDSDEQKQYSLKNTTRDLGLRNTWMKRIDKPGDGFHFGNISMGSR